MSLIQGRIEHPRPRDICGVYGQNLGLSGAGFCTSSNILHYLSLFMGKLWLFVTFRYPNLGLTKWFNTLLLWLWCRTQRKKAQYTQWDERGSAVGRSSGNVVMEQLVYTIDLTTDIQQQALVFRWTVQISSLKASISLNAISEQTLIICQIVEYRGPVFAVWCISDIVYVFIPFFAKF